MRRALPVAMLAAALLRAQQPPPAQLSPSEELKAATAPLAATRAQPNDLTQADLAAYGVGIARAGRACRLLAPTQEEVAKSPDELLALARLCNFAQQFEPARQAAIRYLEIPDPPEREKAILVLIQALLGQQDIVNAAAQIFTLELDFPYGAQVQYAIDEVISAGTLLNVATNDSVLTLCKDQLKQTLPLLDSGKGLGDKDTSIPPSALFADAVRCVEIGRVLHDNSAPATLARLESIAGLPQWQHTAELAPIQSSLARAEMAGRRTPILAIAGRVVHASGLLQPITISLASGTSLLIPYTLWAPSAFPIVRSLHKSAPYHPIYLLTSWAANTGSDDEENKLTLDSLRSNAQALTNRASLVVVSDSVLQQFHADAFPAAIVVRNGVVQANLPLLGDAATRLAARALNPATSDTARKTNSEPARGRKEGSK